MHHVLYRLHLYRHLRTAEICASMTSVLHLPRHSSDVHFTFYDTHQGGAFCVSGYMRYIIYRFGNRGQFPSLGHMDKKNHVTEISMTEPQTPVTENTDEKNHMDKKIC